MRPALSVILFTVLSGAGLGLANALLVLDFIEQFSIFPMGRAIYAEALLSALVLVLIQNLLMALCLHAVAYWIFPRLQSPIGEPPEALKALVALDPL